MLLPCRSPQQLQNFCRRVGLSPTLFNDRHPLSSAPPTAESRACPHSTPAINTTDQPLSSRRTTTNLSERLAFATPQLERLLEQISWGRDLVLDWITGEGVVPHLLWWKDSFYGNSRHIQDLRAWQRAECWDEAHQTPFHKTFVKDLAHAAESFYKDRTDREEIIRADNPTEAGSDWSKIWMRTSFLIYNSAVGANLSSPLTGNAHNKYWCFQVTMTVINDFYQHLEKEGAGGSALARPMADLQSPHEPDNGDAAFSEHTVSFHGQEGDSMQLSPRATPDSSTSAASKQPEPHLVNRPAAVSSNGSSSLSTRAKREPTPSSTSGSYTKTVGEQANMRAARLRSRNHVRSLLEDSSSPNVNKLRKDSKSNESMDTTPARRSTKAVSTGAESVSKISAHSGHTSAPTPHNIPEAEVKKLRKEIVELKNQVSNMRSDLSEMSNGFVEVGNEVSSIEDDMSALRGYLLSLRGDVRQIRGAIADIRQESSDTAEGLSMIVNEIRAHRFETQRIMDRLGEY